MNFHVLGPVQIFDGQEPVAVDGAKARALLACLLIHANTVVSTDRLVEYLWGDRPPRSCLETLYAYVSRLRRLLGPGVLTTRPPGYQLTVEAERLDATYFEVLLGRGRVAVRNGRPRRAVTAFRKALALWRGPALAEFRDEPFAADEVARLEGLRTSALEECLAAELALGRHAEVVEELRQLVVEHPNREALWCHWMLALYRCDRQADALAAYRAAIVRFAEELGIEPGAALRELHHRVLNQDSALDWVPPDPLPAALADAGGRGRLVGRERELGSLSDAWRATREGVPQHVFLAGEPGIGKTRLAVELAMRAHADRATVLWGRARRDSLAPYEPFTEALRDYTDRCAAGDIVERLGPDAADLGLLVSGTAEASGPRTREPKARRYRMFEAVADLLRAAASDRPVLLVLDDLHDADRSTLLLLDHLVRRLRHTPVMILGGYRETDLTGHHPLAALLAALRADDLATHVSIGGLDARGVGQLARVFGDAPLPSVVVRAVQQRTGGNPLFVEEILRDLRATGAHAETAVRRLAVPVRVKDVIAQRLARLPTGVRRALGAASAIGHQFGLGVLAAVLQQPEHVVSELMEVAVESDIVREDGVGPGRYAFSHPLIHDTLYESLTKTRRASLHRRVGEVLERLRAEHAGVSLGELARHFHRSALDDASRAVDIATQAGDEATALLGFAEARSHYEQALDLLRLADPLDRDRRRYLLLALGHARQCEYDTAGARQAFLDAARLSLECDRPDDLATAVLGIMWGIEFGQVDPDTVALLDDALPRLDHADRSLHAKLLATLARALPADDPRVADLARQALLTARRVADPDTSAFVLAATLLATWAPDNSEARRATATELIRLADESGWVEVAMEAHNWRSAVYEEYGDLPASDADLAALDRLAARAGRPFYTATVAMRRAGRALAQGRYDDAERFAAVTLAHGGEGTNFQGAVNLQMFQLYRDRGALGRIADRLVGFIESLPEIPAWGSAHAVLHYELGHLDLAASAVRDLGKDDFAGIPRDWLWIGAMGLLAEVCAGLSDCDNAATVYRLLLPYAERVIVVAHGVLSMGPAARGLGLLAATLGRIDDAERHFRTAIDINTRCGALPWLVRTQLGYADLLLARGARGDVTRARSLLAEAQATAARLGMRVSVSRAA